ISHGVGRSRRCRSVTAGGAARRAERCPGDKTIGAEGRSLQGCRNSTTKTRKHEKRSLIISIGTNRQVSCFRAFVAYVFIMKRLIAALVFGFAWIGLSAQAPDRSKPPALGPAPTLHLPQIQKRQLSNGLPVWIVELHEVPVAQVNLIVMAGSADDPAGKYGIASL